MDKARGTATRYKSGDVCPAAGLYRFDGYVAGAPGPEEMEIQMATGAVFPTGKATGTPVWWQLRKQLLDDTDRLVAIGATNLAGLVTVALSYWCFGLKDCVQFPRWMHGWFAVEGAYIILLFAYDGFRHMGWKLKRAARLVAKKPDEKPSLFWTLRVLVIMNFMIVGWLIVLTGGICKSPFASYGFVMIVMGQFLMERPGRLIWVFPSGTLRLSIAGLVFYLLVLWADSAVPDTLKSAVASMDSTMVWTFFMVAACVLLVGAYASTQAADIQMDAERSLPDK